jgi:hypothetical protein
MRSLKVAVKILMRVFNIQICDGNLTPKSTRARASQKIRRIRSINPGRTQTQNIKFLVVHAVKDAVMTNNEKNGINSVMTKQWEGCGGVKAKALFTWTISMGMLRTSEFSLNPGVKNPAQQRL